MRTTYWPNQGQNVDHPTAHMLIWDARPNLSTFFACKPRFPLCSLRFAQSPSWPRGVLFLWKNHGFFKHTQAWHCHQWNRADVNNVKNAKSCLWKKTYLTGTMWIVLIMFNLIYRARVTNLAIMIPSLSKRTYNLSSDWAQSWEVGPELQKKT